MPTNLNLESLLELQKRVAVERSRILQQLVTVSATKPLPSEALRQLAAIQGVAIGLAEEIETHTPKIGYGAEN